MPVTTKLHLVPIVKGAVDPRKGIIFRTYYIKPERLKSIIKKLHEIPSKSYIIHIPNYENVEKTIKTGNLLYMYDILAKVPGGKESWNLVHNRAETFENIAHIDERRSRLIQSIYYYVLAQDKLAIDCIRQYTPKAIYDWKFSLETKEKDVKPKIRKRKAKEQKIAIIRNLNDVERLINNNKEMKKETKEDYGKVVTYKSKLKKAKVNKETARHLSAFLNFVNINPAKLKVIISNLMTKNSLTDKYGIVGNMMFKPEVYIKEASFWTELLPKLINDVITDEEGIYELKMLELFVPLLCKLDSFKRRTFMKILPVEIPNMDAIEKMIEGKNKEIITDRRYSVWTRMVSILTGFKKEIDKEDIIKAYNQIKNEDKYTILGAGIALLQRKDAWELMNTIENMEESVESIISALLNEDVKSWKWLLGQMVFGNIANYHFVPYSYIRANGIDVFSPSIATKLYTLFVNKYRKLLGKYIKEKMKKASDSFDKDTVEVYMEFNKKFLSNKTLFTHLPPVKVFYLLNKKDKKYLKLKVRKEYLMEGNEEKVLCIMPIEAISDVEGVI